MALDYFIPEIWTSNLLVNMHDNLVYGSPAVVNTDYTGDISRFGDTVRIGAIGSVAVSDYTKYTNHGQAQVLSSAQQVLEITEAKMFNFEIDDIDEVQTNPKLMSQAMREAAFALSAEADDFLSALMAGAFTLGGTASGNYLGDAEVLPPAGGGTPDTSAFEVLVDMARVLDENNAPPEGRWAALTPLIFAELVKDARFTSFGTEPNRAVIRSRAVGTVASFNILISNRAPVDGTDPVILAGSTMATTYAEQINDVEAYRPELRFADAVKGLYLYGGKVVRPEMLTAATAVVTT